MNNYNPPLLKAWNGNIKIQFALNAYNCTMYLVSNVSKAECKMGDLLRGSQQEAHEGILKASDQLRKLERVHSHHCEVTIMESVCTVTRTHIRQSPRQVVFIPTDPNVKTNRKTQMKSGSFNLVDKYIDCPKQLFHIFLTTFVSQ